MSKLDRGGASGDDGPKTVRKFKLVSDRGAELKAMSPAERFFEEEIRPLICIIADLISSDVSDDHSAIFELPRVPDELYTDLVAFLQAKSVNTILGVGKKSFKRMVAVSVSQSFEGWLVVVRPATKPFPEDFLPSESYLFSAKDFCDEAGSESSSSGWVEIVLGIIDKHGKESKEFQDIQRVVTLIRGLLYGERPQAERVDMAKELRLLRLQIGQAAGDIISDFLSYYGSDDELLDEDIGKEGDFNPEFKIGDVNLRKLT